MLKPTTSLFLLLFFGLSAQAQIQFQHEAWEDALAKASNEDKYIFVDAYADWCAPCKKMEKEVFPKEEVSSFFNERFVNVKMNMDKDEAATFARTHQVRTYPTYLFFNEKGELVHRAIGYMAAEEFLEVGNSALSPSDQSELLLQRYKEGNRDPDFLYKFAYAAYNRNDPMYHDVLQLYLDSQDEWSSKKVHAIIFDLADAQDEKAFAYLVENKATFEKEFGADILEEKLLNISIGEVEVLLMEKGGGVKQEEFEAIFKKYFTEDVALKYGSLVTINYYSSLKRWDDLTQTATVFVDKYLNEFEPEQQVNLLLTLAMQLAEESGTEKHFNIAKGWAAKAQTLDSENAISMLIQASCCIGLKDKAKAAKHLDAAAKKLKEQPDPNAESFYKDLREREAKS